MITSRRLFNLRKQPSENVSQGDYPDGCLVVGDDRQMISGFPHRRECEVDRGIGCESERWSHDVCCAGVVGLEQGISDMENSEGNTVVTNQDS